MASSLALFADPPDPAIIPIAIRLADEGIPVRAIARAVKVPSEDIYEALRDALASGAILEVPKDDWPIGSRRSDRTAFNGTPLEDEDNLKVACARLFRVTRLEAAIMVVLLKRSEATKAQLHLVIEQNRPNENREETDPKMVDVVICHLRKKLKRHDLLIDTIWGIGYLISAPHRERATALLNDFSGGHIPNPHGRSQDV